MSTVMIVDDEEWICSVLKDYLEETGISVNVAATISEARQLLRSQPMPEALVLDLTLPDGDGASFLTELRSSGKLGNTPVFLFTAHVLRDSEAARLLRCGFADLIPKPFKLGDFRSRLEQYLHPGPSTSVHEPQN